MSIRRLSEITLLAAFTISCSSTSSDSGKTGETGIGATGGTVTSTDGGATLSIPAGALSSSTAITVTPMTSPPAAAGLVTSSTYDFAPSGTQFASPATLRITYQPSTVPTGVDPTSLHLVMLNGTEWDAVAGSTVDNSAHVVTGPISHFSSYGVCGGTCGVVTGGFIMTTTPDTLPLTPGTSAGASVSVTRTTFTDLVSLSVTGLPSGVTAAFAPAQLTGTATASTVTFTATTSAVTGFARVIVHGSTASLADHADTITLNVIKTGSAIQFDYSACLNKAVWFAYQDGSGPWTVVTGSNNVYTVPAFASGKGGVAAVLPTTSGHNTIIQYLTATEMATSAAQRTCPTGATGATLIGTVSGMASGETATVSLGGVSGSTTANGPVQLVNVPSGATDVVAYLQQTTAHSSIADRVIINRGATAPGTINFGGTFATTATATVTNGTATLPAPQMAFITNAASCQTDGMYILSPSSTSFLFGGVPDSLQQVGDLHALTSIDAGSASGRQVTNWFHSVANQTLTYGASLVPTIDTLLGNYKRVRASFTLPSDYGFASLSIGPNAGQAVQAITESSGYAAGSAMTLVVPEFTGLSGFLPAWEPAVGAPQNYNLFAQSGSMYTIGCVAGGASRAAYAFGSK